MPKLLRGRRILIGRAPDGGDGIGDRLGKACIQKTTRLVQIDDDVRAQRRADRVQVARILWNEELSSSTPSSMRRHLITVAVGHATDDGDLGRIAMP